MHWHTLSRIGSIVPSMIRPLAALLLLSIPVSSLGAQSPDDQIDIVNEEAQQSMFAEQEIGDKPPHVIQNFILSTEDRIAEIGDTLKAINERQLESSDTLLQYEVAENLAKLAKGGKDVPRSRIPENHADYLGWKTLDTIRSADIKTQEQKLRTALRQFRETIYKDSVKREQLEEEREIADEDLDLAYMQFSESSSQVFFENQFKQAMSTIFAILIALVIGGFFLIIALAKGTVNLSEALLSDGGLQFITIFVLIIAVVLFGVLKILEGRELAAILSGIAGYILGRSTSMTKVTRNDDGGSATEPKE